MGINSRDRFRQVRESHPKDYDNDPSEIPKKNIFDEAYDRVLSKHGVVRYDDLSEMYAKLLGVKIPSLNDGKKIWGYKILPETSILRSQDSSGVGHTYVVENEIEGLDKVIPNVLRHIEDSFVLGRRPKTKNLLDRIEED